MLPGRPTLSINRGGRHRSGSPAKEQAKAHIPTLKGLGKSECEVKIVSILECESLVPLDALLDHSSCKSTVNDFPVPQFFILMPSSPGYQCYAASPF
jgi:hypothetical protein